MDKDDKEIVEIKKSRKKNKKKENKKKRIDNKLDTSSFLVEFLYKICNWIWEHSPLYLIKHKVFRKAKDKHNLITEVWVLIVLISGLFCLLVYLISDLNLLINILLFIIIVRILLILNASVRIILHYVVKGGNVESAERSLILFSMNFFEIIFWFGGFYRLCFERLYPEKYINPFQSLHYSFVSATGIGVQDILTKNQAVQNISLIESVIGFMMIAFILVRFISSLSADKKFLARK